MEPNGITSEHFSYAELACHHCGSNQVQQSLLDALEELRRVATAPIHVDCAYRCANHNAELKNAAKNSQHLRGIAADIKIIGMKPAEMYEAAKKVPAFANGGIGVAEFQGYIHVDVRGTKARWCYDAHGAVCAWDVTLDEPVI